jgi:acyl carrier protein
MKVSIERLEEIFSAAFSEKIRLDERKLRSDMPVWDSINHLNLIVELEEKLDVSFSQEEIESIDSVSALINILENK